jgi:hypothetical protein
MSPRNSPAAVCHMLRASGAHRLLTTEAALRPLLADVQRELAADGYELALTELPAFTDIYPRFARETVDDAFEPIAMAQKEAYPGGIPMYIHSSGKRTVV